MNNYNHSRPLDVHVWSEHPEINVLVNEVWSRFWEEDAAGKPKRGPKPKAPKKKHLKVLLLDLYVCWQSDPSMYLSVHMSKSGWKANSRYNALNLSSQMIGIIKRLTDLGFLEFKKGFEGKLSRIRPTEKLELLFKLTKLKHDDISHHHDKEMLVIKELNTFPEVHLLKTQAEISEHKCQSCSRGTLNLVHPKRLNGYPWQCTSYPCCDGKGKMCGQCVNAPVVNGKCLNPSCNSNKK